MQLRVMEKSDYKKVYNLWSQIEGFGLRSIDDSKENIERFLDRNPNTSVVVECDNKNIIASILCGHDGRTGYFYHVCVKEEFRMHGLGHKMVDFCIKALKYEKINKISLIAFKQNTLGNKFWANYNFIKNNNIFVYELSLNENNVTTFLEPKNA